MQLIKTTDTSLPWVDHSTMTAVNTCPRWGIIHSIHGKRLTGGVERVLPLEAGRAMHDVFACARFFDLYNHIYKHHDNPVLYTAMHEHARRIFGAERWDQAHKYLHGLEDAGTRCMQMALNLLETSGYHDDPRDNRRTQSNLESAAISYIQHYPFDRFIPVYNPDTGADIGIEIPFDVTLVSDDIDGGAVRFVGRVDAVCCDTLKGDALPEVHENKTGARIDTVWSSSFDTSHQVTGYCAAMSCMFNKSIDNVMMWGLQIPIPKSSSYTDGFMRYPVNRSKDQYYEWARWVLHTLQIIKMYKDIPTDAPMYTHSCNRYFRSCAYIPLCTETAERRRFIFENEMVTDRWSPLDEEVAR